MLSNACHNASFRVHLPFGFEPILFCEIIASLLALQIKHSSRQIMNFKKLAKVALAIAAFLCVASFALGIKGFIGLTRTLRAESKEADNVATNANPAALMAACRILLDDHRHQPATLVSDTYVKLFPETDDAKQPLIGTNIPSVLLALKPTVVEIAPKPNNIVIRLRPHARNLIIYDEQCSLTNELWYFNGRAGESGYILLGRELKKQPDNKYRHATRR